jgi:hypothetical protein
MTEAKTPRIPLIEEDPKTRPTRSKRVLSELVKGASFEEVRTREKITPRQMEHILRSVLRKRWMAPAQDFARLQIARLDGMMTNLMARIEKGELGAIDRALKIVDRLDRYHGFSRAPFNAIEPYGDEERVKLFNKLNRAADLVKDDSGEESPQE